MAFPWLAVATALGAGATAYSGYQAAKGARKQAEAASAATAESRRRAQAELAQMQKDSAAQQRQFTLQIEQAQAATRQQSEAAAASLAQGERAAGAARAASNLAIHRSQLQAAIARQSGQSNIKKQRRAKRATPAHMRTKLSIDSGIDFTSITSPECNLSQSLRLTPHCFQILGKEPSFNLIFIITSYK